MASIFEDVADLYLRLNGYFTVKNFFQHPSFDAGVGETDIDILAIRLPDEREVTGRDPKPLPHDLAIVDPKTTGISVVIAEAKGDADHFNAKWFRDPEVLMYALRRVGFTHSERAIQEVAEQLRTSGRASIPGATLSPCEFRLVLFSNYVGSLPHPDYRAEPFEGIVINWDRSVAFLKERFDLLGTIKRGQGPLKDAVFGYLFSAYRRSKLSPGFLHSVRPAQPPYKPRRQTRGNRPCPQ